MNTSTNEKRDWSLSAGPWDSEPDRAEFEHAGLPCLLKRHRSAGSWCGYVHVPPYNPALRDAYDEEGYAYWAFDVHGGVTFDGKMEMHGSELFVIGFDLNHSHDGAPGDLRWETRLKGEYRTFEYAEAEVRSLAEQIAGYKPVEQLTNLFSGTLEADYGKEPR